jgi:L-rhamnose-H+ transport protein
MVFGFGWGIGSVFFGLGIDKVGMALGFAIVLGITASFGSLLPLAILRPDRLLTRQGYALMAGTALVLVGLVFLSVAGRRRERETVAPTAPSAKSGFAFGMLLCILSGIFSAMLNFSFVFGKELATAAMSANPVWALALSAGFLANSAYCGYLLNKNHTWPVFCQGRTLAYSGGVILMGLLWFGGIAAYGVGAASLGDLGGIVGWPLLMAMEVIAANFWGALTGEWTRASRVSRCYWWSGIASLLVAIYVISLGGAGSG